MTVLFLNMVTEVCRKRLEYGHAIDLAEND